MERTPNKSQHTQLTVEKKILPPLLPGFELAAFLSRVRRSNQQATPIVVRGTLRHDIFYAHTYMYSFFLQSQRCVYSTPVLPQWHVKDPGHSAKSACGRLHLNTHSPLTQQSRSGLTTPLCRHSVGTYQETSSHATRKGTLCHSRLSSLSLCGLILA